jgi:F-type H+-transporting ATPase subunit b
MRRLALGSFPGWRALVSSAALAAVSAPALAGSAMAADEAEGGGLPQFDVSTFASQIFWLVVAFVVLYLLLVRRGLPRVAEILETRQRRITADLDRAAELRAEAGEVLKRYEDVVASAHLSAQREVKEAQDRLAADLAAQQGRLDAELATKVREAEDRITTAKRSALAQVTEVAVEAIQAATKRLVGLDISEEAARAAAARAHGETAS